MTLHVAIVGAGPAGLAVASSLLTEVGDAEIDLIDRADLPDRLLRHGPAAGVARLVDVARQVDAVIGDQRVTFYGNVEVGVGLGLAQIKAAAHAVILATGAPGDLPLDIAGHDSVGVGTISHVEAWLAGSADVAVDELDLAMDSAVLIGVSPETLHAAEVLCGRTPHGVSLDIAERLADRRLRHVQMVDSRPCTELEVPTDIPENLVIRTGLVPVGVVGRNRARAVRCVHHADEHGRVITEDLRAQLLLRPVSTDSGWPGLDADFGRTAHRSNRVLSGGAVVDGLYVAGWAGRAPEARGSHGQDAEAVVAAVQADRSKLQAPQRDIASWGVQAAALQHWSAVAATTALLERFAGEGRSPTADYEALLEQVEED